MLTHQQAKLLFDYNPATGHLVWRSTGRRTGGEKREKGNPKCRVVSVGSRSTRQRLNEANIIWLWMTGAWPTHVVDHIDGDPFNNVWNNLRAATPRENSMNRRPITSTGWKWAYLEPKTGKYIAQIKVNGKNKCLGTFASPQDAHNAALALTSTLHGKFTRAT